MSIFIVGRLEYIHKWKKIKVLSHHYCNHDNHLKFIFDHSCIRMHFI